MNNKITKINIIIIFLLFIIVVLIRTPFLDRPLGYHHEWLTAITLRIQQIWHEEGALKYGFNPILTYGNKADKHIDNTHTWAPISDKAGNYYYISYGPFGLILPYLIFKASGIYPNILNIQIFNIILHFIGGIFVYLIILKLTRKDEQKKINIPALIGFFVYSFSPIALWFYSNVYSSEMLVATLFVISIYIFLIKIINLTKKNDFIYTVLLGILIFLMIYTEWLGIFLASFILLYYFLNFKKRGCRSAFFVILFFSVLSLILIVYQYSQIDGFDSFINSYISKYWS